MPGYKNRTIRKDFDDLGDDVYVVIRNPKLVPPAVLIPTDVKLDADGKPVDPAAAATAMYGPLSRLVIQWNVYDGMDDSDDPAPLDVSPESVGKIPSEIITWIMDEMGRGLAKGAPAEDADPN